MCRGDRREEIWDEQDRELFRFNAASSLGEMRVRRAQLRES